MLVLPMARLLANFCSAPAARPSGALVSLRWPSTRIVNQLQQVVAARWHATLRQHGTTPTDCEKLAGAFNYPGFELDPAVVLAGQ